jgi:hypothetical protein
VRARAGTVLVAALLLAGCTSFTESADPSGSRSSPSGVGLATAVPADPLTVVAGSDPAGSAVGASRALFTHAELAVVARDDDPAGALLGASAAVGLGAPLLLTPAGGSLADDPLGAELDRLGARTVLSVGADPPSAAGGGPEVVAVPASTDAVERATGLRLADADPVADGDAVEAVAGLDPQRPAGLRPQGADQAPDGDGDGGRMPRVPRPAPLRGVTVLATDGPESLAGAATARAAGARVEVLRGTADPRTSPDVIKALSADGAGPVVTLGAGLADNPDLDWQLATARTGTELPGGGQTLFPGRMLVALYGSPGTPALGVLGEQDVDATVQRTRDHAAAFEDLVDVPILPTFEIIVTVASSAAGPDGNYSTEIDPEKIRPWVEAARDAGVYVVLDLQPGRADFLTQAKQYESLLELPDVGLALDPEWRLAPGQMPLAQIGSVGVDEVNAVSTWLADLTRDRQLPQKLFVVHQFRLSTLPDRERMDTSRPELAVMIHADGQGTQGDKQATWQALHQDLPPGPLRWGWKNFYDEDHPMLTPQQTIEQVDPRPDLVTYQ